MADDALLPVAHYRARVCALGPLRPAAALTDPAALRGAVLAGDLVATTDLPPFPSSAMDGVAVHAADAAALSAADAVQVLAVGGAGAAGDPAGEAPRPGFAVRVMTGAPLPPGTAAVVPVEATAAVPGGRLEVHGPVRPDQFCRPAGSDVTAGALVLAAGTRLGPAQLAAVLAAAAGPVLAHPAPRVAVLSTGSELCDPTLVSGVALVGPQVPDTNRAALLALVSAAGAHPVDGGRVRDDPAELRKQLQALAAVADLVVTTGGVSMGDFDVVKAAAGPGAPGAWADALTFVKVAMQPGMPQALGRVPGAGTPVLGLPGNPVSALVSAEVFLRPLLGAPRHPRTAVLRAPVAGSPAAKEQYVRAVADDDGGVTPLPGSGSHQLASYAAADSLIVLPVGTRGASVGQAVPVLDLRP